MKITNVHSPHAVQQTNTNTHAQAEAKARAVAKLSGQPAPTQGTSGQQPTQQHVTNQNNVSVEEMSALQVPQFNGQKPISTEVNEVVEATETTEETAQETKAPISAELEQLARKERVLRAKQMQQDKAYKEKERLLATKEADFKAKEEAWAAKEREYQTNYISKQKVKEQTLDALAEADVNYEVLMQQLATGQTPTDPRVTAYISKLEAKLNRLEQAAELGQKTQAEAQTQQYQQAIKQITVDVKSLVKDDPAFEAIRVTPGAVKEVVQLIEDTFHSDGVLMSVEEATQLVEDELTERYNKVTQIEKIKKRMSANSSVPAKAEAVKTSDAQTPQTKQTQPMKTLTNAAGTSRKLSVRERAMLAFEGKLK